ncbi:MAG: oligosaccharide flippase family protein [Crocinitomicaceae bacterium]
MLKKLYSQSNFMKSVFVLITGTVLAQGIGIVIMPFLTRIYEPEALGELNIYMRLVGLVSGVATARFEISLPLPKYEGHSFLLYKLSLRIAMFSLMAMGVVGALYYLIKPVSVYNISFLTISIASTFFIVYINLGTNWSIRNKAFKAISRQKIVNAVVSNGLRYGFGYLSFGSLGLLFATLIGYMVSSLWYIRDFVRLKKGTYKNYSKKKNKVLVKEYREFPLVNLPHVAVDLGRELLIAVLVTYYFGIEIFGLYSVSVMILRMPLTIIGTSIGQVFYGEISEMVNQGKSVHPILKKTILTLLMLSIVPFSLIYFFGEPIFEFVLGSSYSESGFYSEIMAVWLMTLFLIAPTSSLPLVLKRQKEFFFIGTFASITQVLIFFIFPVMWGGTAATFETMLWVLSISQAIILLGVISLALYYSKKRIKNASV